jgi:hypothetical protein
MAAVLARRGSSAIGKPLHRMRQQRLAQARIRPRMGMVMHPMPAFPQARGSARHRRDLIVGNERVMRIWYEAKTGKPGNPNREEGSGRLAPSPIDNNVNNRDKPRESSVGNTAAAGILRLSKAARKGDEKAADMSR